MLKNVRLTGFIQCRSLAASRMEIYIQMIKGAYCSGILAALRISPGMRIRMPLKKFIRIFCQPIQIKDFS